MTKTLFLLVASALALDPVQVPEAVFSEKPPGSLEQEAEPLDHLEMVGDDHFVEDEAILKDRDEDNALWTEHMQNFHADLMVTFESAGGSKEFFYADVKPEDINTPAALLRGAYFVSHNIKEKNGIDFTILDPNNQPIYSRSDRPEAIFARTATIPGTYTFSISNANSGKGKQVTFIVGAGARESLKKEHIMSLDDRVKEADRLLRDIQQEGGFFWKRQKSILESMESINTKVFWFTIAEFAVLAVVAVVQVYSTKGLLSYRRLY